MKCSNCDKESDSYCGWPVGWVWVQTNWFKAEGPSTEGLNDNKPYYLLCPKCKEKIFAGMRPYKTVIKQEVVPA